MAAWWLLNLIQAAFTGLANDESYYWYYSQHLAWGYFDHPPMVALLVWLSSWLPAELGVRFCSTLLQPLYLLLFWHLIKPAAPTARTAWTYVLVCFSQPLLQLYGFMALPDAPLMMGTVLFLWAYKRFSGKSNILNATLLGASAALLGYSKYHGALVVALAVLATPRLLKDWRLYYAGAVALILMIPHLWWQQQHDWVSFRYHLLDRNASSYSAKYTLEFLATLLVIFNPLWLGHYFRGLKRLKSSFLQGTPLDRALTLIGIGFPLFFLLSTLRGPAQAQWLLPAVFPCVALVTRQSTEREAEAADRYTRAVCLASLVLFLTVRIIAMANPFSLRGEIWQQRETYVSIAKLADGRPVQFMHNYTAASKYRFYTGGEAYCAPYFFNRHSQWQYDTTDHSFTGREVVVGNFTNRKPDSLALPNSKTFYYTAVSDFHPLREVSIRPLQPIDATLGAMPAPEGEGRRQLPLTLLITNPYPYDICSTDSLPLRLTLFFLTAPRQAPTAQCLFADTLHARSTDTIHVTLDMPESLPDGVFTAGFALNNSAYPSDNSRRFRIKVCNSKTSINIRQQ